jgi:hypothetical protein
MAILLGPVYEAEQMSALLDIMLKQMPKNSQVMKVK